MTATAALRTLPKKIATPFVFGVFRRIDIETAGPGARLIVSHVASPQNPDSRNIIRKERPIPAASTIARSSSCKSLHICCSCRVTVSGS